MLCYAIFFISCVPPPPPPTKKERLLGRTESRVLLFAAVDDNLLFELLKESGRFNSVVSF